MDFIRFRIMSRMLPETEGEMRKIPHFTAAIYEKYGPPLLDITQRYAAEKISKFFESRFMYFFQLLTENLGVILERDDGANDFVGNGDNESNDGGDSLGSISAPDGSVSSPYFGGGRGGYKRGGKRYRGGGVKRKRGQSSSRSKKRSNFRISGRTSASSTRGSTSRGASTSSRGSGRGTASRSTASSSSGGLGMMKMPVPRSFMPQPKVVQL